MNKFVGIVLTLVLAVSAGFAKPENSPRQQTYNQLVQKRQELLSWSEAHPMAPRFVAVFKEKEARQMRERLYVEFPDLRKKEIAQFKQELRREVQNAQDIPYITFNTLPVENLKKIAKNKNLLVELLRMYPDNAIYLSDSYLLGLFKEDESLEELMVFYLLYLKMYHASPASFNFSKQQQQRLEELHREGNMPGLYKMLFVYSSYRMSQKRQELAQKYVQNSLVSAFSSH